MRMLQEGEVATEDGVDPEEGFDTTNRDGIFLSTVIPIQFDFRNHAIAFFRTFASRTYWYLAGILVL
jgi:hypothetical protein